MGSNVNSTGESAITSTSDSGPPGRQAERAVRRERGEQEALLLARLVERHHEAVDLHLLLVEVLHLLREGRTEFLVGFLHGLRLLQELPWDGACGSRVRPGPEAARGGSILRILRLDARGGACQRGGDEDGGESPDGTGVRHGHVAYRFARMLAGSLR
jgi:hypothetical protein